MPIIKQIVGSRWFPSVTKPLVTAAVASGVTVGLHSLGVTAFVPNEVNQAVAPLVGLIVGAITAKPSSTEPVAPATPAAPVTIGEQIAELISQEIAAGIDANPQAIREFGLQLIEQVTHPLLVTPPAQATPAVPASVMPTSADAPHITQ